MNLYPTILTDSIDKVQEQVNLVRDVDAVKVVQVDIIDGFFADNLTVTPLDLLAVNFGRLKIDFHLMTNEPMDFVLEAESIKEKLKIRAVIAQLERMSYPIDYLRQLKDLNWQAGLSLDLYTPVEAIEEELWPELDIVQVLGVKAGAQGQDFQLKALDKIKEINAKNPELKKELEIIVDGGVKLSNARQIIRAGATGLAVGSELWQAKNIKKVIEKYFNIL
ncbi:MAG: hypothetical protein PVJ09_05285 [Candidatus Woesebacteria bacterium]|jgi:ribulose-phosphate 3-epimerase